MMLVVKVYNYAYDIWFEVIDLDTKLNELTISDHLLGGQIVFSMDETMEFKVMEDKL